MKGFTEWFALVQWGEPPKRECHQVIDPFKDEFSDSSCKNILNIPANPLKWLEGPGIHV